MDINITEEKEKSRTQAELAFYWEEISKNLPNSIERSALGDEKIFNAFATAYPKIKASILIRQKELNN